MNKLLCLIVIFLSAPLSTFGMEWKQPRLTYPKKSQAMVQAIEEEKNKKINQAKKQEIKNTKKRKLEEIEVKEIKVKENELKAYYDKFNNYDLAGEVTSKRRRLEEPSSKITVKTSSAAHKTTPSQTPTIQTPTKKSSVSVQTNNISPAPHQGTPYVDRQQPVKTLAPLSLAPLSYGKTPRKSTREAAHDAVELAELIDAKISAQNYKNIRSFLQNTHHIVKSSHSSAQAKNDPYIHTLRYLPEGRVLIDALEGEKTKFLDENGNIVTPEEINYSYADKEKLIKKAKKLYKDAINEKKTTNNSTKK